MFNSKNQILFLRAFVTTIGLVLGSAQTCHADLVTFIYHGTVDNDTSSGPNDLTTGSPEAAPYDAFNGDTIRLAYTFSSDLSDINSGANGLYRQFMDLEVSLGSNNYVASGITTIGVINDGINSDQYQVRSQLTGPSVGGLSRIFLSLTLTDSTQNFFTTDDLPTTQPNPVDFDLSELRFDFSTAIASSAAGTIGTRNVIAVPEPSSTLVGVCVYCCIALRRKKQPRSNHRGITKQCTRALSRAGC